LWGRTGSSQNWPCEAILIQTPAAATFRTSGISIVLVVSLHVEPAEPRTPRGELRCRSADWALVLKRREVVRRVTHKATRGTPAELCDRAVLKSLACPLPEAVAGVLGLTSTPVPWWVLMNYAEQDETGELMALMVDVCCGVLRPHLAGHIKGDREGQHAVGVEASRSDHGDVPLPPSRVALTGSPCHRSETLGLGNLLEPPTACLVQELTGSMVSWKLGQLMNVTLRHNYPASEPLAPHGTSSRVAMLTLSGPVVSAVAADVLARPVAVLHLASETSLPDPSDLDLERCVLPEARVTQLHRRPRG
jgi:hypothetical protein